jgi:predicted DsbA family dithiol-disulfide isomerase
MGQSSLDAVRQEIDLEVEWKAFELRPAGSPPPDPAYRARIDAGWPRVVAMGREYGVEMRSHRFGIDTRPAHRALKIVQRLAPALAEPYHMGLFRAYFTEDQDIGDPAVLRALAKELGIDGEAVARGLAADEALAEVLHDEEAAYEGGISGVPAFVFLDKYLLSGVRPAEQIKAIIEQIREREGVE